MSPSESILTTSLEDRRAAFETAPEREHCFRFGVDHDGRYKCLCQTTARTIMDAGVAAGQEWYAWTGKVDRYGRPVNPAGDLLAAWIRAEGEPVTESSMSL
jgi:hypothetical protein